MNKISRSNWGTHLSLYVTGKAQAALKRVRDDLLDDYDSLKETLLTALEDTPSHADRRWWSLSQQPDEPITYLFSRVCSTAVRRLDGIYDRDAIMDKSIHSCFLSLLNYPRAQASRVM